MYVYKTTLQPSSIYSSVTFQNSKSKTNIDFNFGRHETLHEHIVKLTTNTNGTVRLVQFIFNFRYKFRFGIVNRHTFYTDDVYLDRILIIIGGQFT